jgi:site-specific recombinase XerD
VGTHVAAALGRGYHCHQLRHRFATVVYAGCHDVLVVQRLLGHADVATTMIYVGIGQESERAAVLSVA